MELCACNRLGADRAKKDARRAVYCILPTIRSHDRYQNAHRRVVSFRSKFDFDSLATRELINPRLVNVNFRRISKRNRYIAVSSGTRRQVRTGRCVEMTTYRWITSTRTMFRRFCSRNRREQIYLWNVSRGMSNLSNDGSLREITYRINDGIGVNRIDETSARDAASRVISTSDYKNVSRWTFTRLGTKLLVVNTTTKLLD